MSVDLSQKNIELQNFISKCLHKDVKVILSTELTQSSRQAPWKIDVIQDGLEKSYVFQLDKNSMEHEYNILKAVEGTGIKAPKPYCLDMEGKWFGFPVFFSDFIPGESLLAHVLNNEAWAIDLYLEAVSQMHKVTFDDLGEIGETLERETAVQILEEAYAFLRPLEIPVVEKAYKNLVSNLPVFPELCFSNGDLWLDNFIVKDKKLSGIIDFANACFSDPIFEFLLSFFAETKLQDRGIEERFCEMNGYDPKVLDWYHGLEFFDTLRWVIKTGKSFQHHSEESLKESLKNWVNQG